MRRRDSGFTLIEILVVITIIAALVGMVTLVIPQGQEKKDLVTCMNNLNQIGGLLATLQAGKGYKEYSGAAFVLQVADEVGDEDLKVFNCPGDKDAARPESGSAEFIAMFRKDMNLKEGKVEDKHCSYAGPNFKDHPIPKAGAAAKETRLWACDKCRNGAAQHNGIVVLYTSTKVEKLEVADLEGHNKEEGTIVVGPNSGDKRLAKMIFFPAQ